MVSGFLGIDSNARASGSAAKADAGARRDVGGDVDRAQFIAGLVAVNLASPVAEDRDFAMQLVRDERCEGPRLRAGAALRACLRAAPVAAVACAVVLAGVDITNVDVGGWHEHAWGVPAVLGMLKPAIRFLA